MKKIASGLLIASSIFALSGVIMIDEAQAVTTNITASLGVTSTITLTCVDGAITMGSIAGTGQSALTTNSEDCTIKTNNSTGYDLGISSQTAVTMNNGSDTIAAYTPAVAATPETWAVAGAASEWGFHIGSTSTTVNTTTWGAADTYAGGKWLNTTLSNVSAANRTTETTGSGDVEKIYVGAEIGATAFQPTGTYTNTIILTAVTNP